MNQLKYDREVTPEILAQVQANSDRFAGQDIWDIMEEDSHEKASLFWPMLALDFFLSYMGRELAPLNIWTFVYCQIAAIGILIYCGREVLKDWGWIKR